MESRLVERKNTRGFSHKILESYLFQLVGKEDWGTFMDILALTLNGVMLFPNIECFVDYVAINVFVAIKTRAGNPMTTILAYVYDTLNLCYEMKTKKMSCCLLVLYVLVISRGGENVININCPVNEVLQHGPEMKGEKGWA